LRHLYAFQWVGFRRSNFRRSKQEVKSFYDQEIKFFPIFQEIESFNNNSISWSMQFSGDQKLKIMLLRLSISWSIFQPPEQNWQILLKLPTSWKMWLLISWNLTSWSFPVSIITEFWAKGETKKRCTVLKKRWPTQCRHIF